MQLPPLQSPISASYHTSGDVAIATDAVIASGVVLMADPSARIVIGAGACLGLGVVLHASQGAIVVEAGASLGAGVLAVGNCRIGTQACVGASTTLYNTSIPPSQLVAPGSLLGEIGRPATSSAPGSSSAGSNSTFSGQGVSSDFQVKTEQNGFHNPEAEPSPWDEPGVSPPSGASSSDRPSTMDSGDASATANSGDSSDSTSSAASAASSEESVSKPQRPKKPAKIYGKDQFERMRTLFLPNSNL